MKMRWNMATSSISLWWA